MAILRAPYRYFSILWKQQVFKLLWFSGPSEQNELYHTPSLSKIWDLRDIFLYVGRPPYHLENCKLRWLNAVPKRTLDLKWEPLWQSLLLSKSSPLCCSPYSSSPYVISFHIWYSSTGYHTFFLRFLTCICMFKWCVTKRATCSKALIKTTFPNYRETIRLHKKLPVSESPAHDPWIKYKSKLQRKKSKYHRSTA